MLALAIEGSTSRASIAIQKDHELLYEEFSDNPKTHSEFLNAAIERGLKKTSLELSQFDVFACTTGPGSFTGIRVASNIMKSFSMLFKKPMFVIDSLNLLAAAAFEKDVKLTKALCLLCAPKNTVYVGLFEKNCALISPTSLKIEEVGSLKNIDHALGLGDGFKVYEEILKKSSNELFFRDQSQSDFPDSKILCRLALEAFKQGKTIEWNFYKPLYIRDSEAEEVLKLKTK